MISQILNIAWKEFLQIRRDRFLIIFLILAPTLQLILISHNTARGLSDIAVAALDQDQTALSHEFIQELDATQEMVVRFWPQTHQQLRDLLDSDKVQVGIVIPAGFERRFNSPLEAPAQIQALVDGSNILVGGNGDPVISGVLGRLIAWHVQEPPGLDVGGVQVYSRALFNPSYNIQWFIIPSTLAFITYQVALVLAATGFVREKETGTLEQLMITPIRRLELIIGKSIPPILLSVLNFLLLMAVQTWGYHIPIRGDFIQLLLLAILAIIAIVGLGTVISILTQNQQQAVLLVFLIAILEVTISGYMLPVENMPWLMRGFAQISALQHFMTASLAIIFRGADFSMILPQILALLAIIFSASVIAWRAFSRYIA